MPRTPVTGLGLYDGLYSLDAVIESWRNAGPRPAWHEARKREVRDAMPLLARALDRLAQESQR